MKVCSSAKVTLLDYAKATQKVTANFSKPCNERDLSCSGKIAIMPPR